MHLHSAQDPIQMTKKKGRDCYCYCCDVARTFWHLPFNPVDWPLMCIKAEGGVIMVNITLPDVAKNKEVTSRVSNGGGWG